MAAVGSSATTAGQRAAGNDAVREVVESFLDAEDLNALVRLVFNAGPSQRRADAAAAIDARTRRMTDPDSSVEAATTAPALELDPAEAVAQMLENIAAEQRATIESICRTNTEEMARALSGLGQVKSLSENLHERLMEHNTELQLTGGTFAQSLTELHHLQRTQTAVTASKQAMEVAVGLLRKCTTAGEMVADGRLHAALRLLLSVRAQLTPSRTTSISSIGGPVQRSATANGGTAWQSTDLRTTSKPADLGKLQPFLTSKLETLLKGVEQAALANSNDWLVSVREHASTIGLRALVAAAQQAGKDQAAAKEQRLLQTQLLEVGAVDPADVAKLAVAAAGLQQLDPTVHPMSARLLKTSSGAASADLLDGVDMTLLHRALHVHEALGKLQLFQEYYQNSRQRQLQTELQPPTHAAFIAKPDERLSRLVGFFVVEDRVQQDRDRDRDRIQATAPAQLAALKMDFPWVGAAWEEASTRIKEAVEHAAEATAATQSTSDPGLLGMKDCLLLACSALGKCGYHVKPTLEVLNKRTAGIYHRHLCEQYALQVDNEVKSDSRAKVSINSANTLAEMALTLGLPTSLSDSAATPASVAALVPKLPLRAPFSAMAPNLLTLACRFVNSSFAWWWGLAAGAELRAAVRQDTDEFLSKVAIPVLQHAVDTCAQPGPKNTLEGTLQLVTNIWALQHGLAALDTYTFFCCRGFSPGAAARAMQQGQGPRAGLASELWDMQAWGSLQRTAEASVAGILTRRTAEVITRSKELPWLPESDRQGRTWEPQQQGGARTAMGHSAYISELRTFMQESLRVVAASAPPSVASGFALGMFAFCSQTIIALLAGDAVPAFNLFAIFRLNDDVAVLTQLADSLPYPNLKAGLDEVQQLCDVLISGPIAEIVKPSQASKYPALRKTRLLEILPKYRDVGEKESRSKHFVKKAAVEHEVKKLRAERKEGERIRRTTTAAGVPAS
ncbi:hypothetical protein WJX73_005699 [Symbiochloris irregularis]|uniref:Exocyst complex component Sec10 n=1 Tax=Symbiochloris irregularis TaxID=706552 RepID=A0AAW1PHI3_9CHLO